MDVALLEARRVDAERGGAVLDQAERRLRALLHHLAELAGEDQPPVPGMRVASMNRMSPPTGVQARPVATPGTLVRIATSLSNCGGAEDGWEVVRLDAGSGRFAFRDAHRGMAQRLADLALETAHTGFARVVLDDLADARRR